MDRFDVGDKVIVTNESLRSYGLIGTITWSSKYDVAILVKFEDWYGQGSKELYIKKNNLSKDVNATGGSIMSVKGNYNVAMVKFVQGTNTTKEYGFALFNELVGADDLVLCDTTNGYNVAKVSKIIPQNEYNGAPVTKEIICKVDFSEFEERKERRKQKEALKKQMDKMVNDNQELILYQAIAEKNPQMAEMLAAYKALNDV